MTKSIYRSTDLGVFGPAKAAASPSLVLSVATCLLTGTVGNALASSAARNTPLRTECSEAGCQGLVRGKAVDNSSTGNLVPGENTERETLADEGTVPFVITVDGEVVDKSGKKNPATFGSPSSVKPVDRQRKADVDLEAVDIQVKFDGLDQRALLNVSTMPVRRAYRAGETVEFLATSNYPAFIARSEVRIFDLSDPNSASLVVSLPAFLNGTTQWTMPDTGSGEYGYVLRVYDAKGRYDETEMLSLSRSASQIAPAAQKAATAPGMAEDRTAVRNIPIQGGAVTVFGRNVPPGYDIIAFGERIPVDPHRSFVAQRILSSGDHTIDVAVSGPSKGGGLTFSRDVTIPRDDWFYVALADLTLGRRTGDRDIETVRGDEYERLYAQGGASFYLKGKIKGQYLLTAAGQVDGDDLPDLLNNATRRDPKKLLKRLDPDRYYPVYGDDSSAVDDAPTDGKLFVRLERGDSHVMWGNYRTHITGTEFLRSERNLYGASAAYRSDSVTGSGEHRTEATAFASQPGTLPQRDEFLATGGSVYFLKRQDILPGSAAVTVELRDRLTKRVVQRKTLDEGRDYSINHLQGLVLLKQPLSVMTFTDGPVRDDALGGQESHLVVQYEYTPRNADKDAYSYGGRAQHWLADRLRIGVTGTNEKGEEATRRAVGADFQLRLSPKTRIEGEIARSHGKGFQSVVSTDGGLTFGGGGASTASGEGAVAWRLRGELDLEDLRGLGLKGVVGGGYEKRKAGFSEIANDTSVGQKAWDAHADLEMTDNLGLKLGYKEFRDGAGQVRQDADAASVWDIGDKLSFSAGISHTRLISPEAIAAGKSGYDGSRVDGGVRLEYRPDDDKLVYAFGQGTIGRSGDIDRNDRAGVGGQIKLTEKVKLLSEASFGTHGLGGGVTADYAPTADDGYYVGYRLDPDRVYGLRDSSVLEGNDNGTIVAGSRRRVNEMVTAYAENTYDMFGHRNSLARTYGVNYTPDALWTVDASIQTGSIRDGTIDSTTGKQKADFDRNVVSMSTRYRDEEAGIDGHLRGEARFEDSDDGSRDNNSYFFSTGIGWNTDPDWRFLASLEGVVSDADTTFLDGEYLEASIGYAYRPVDNDRLNALFKYTYLSDEPGAQQVSALTGTQDGPQQRSHILSADVNYDLYPWLTVGAKWGLRLGGIGHSTPDGVDWVQSLAHLGIVRADLHLIKSWDLLLEGRALYSPSAGTRDYGALVAVYRHIGDNLKIGAGYNFGRFSDDLRDVTLDDQGWFVNVVGKY